ncbi:hypothetical protein RFI_25545 [Reticulomyxa filosa]|uniref:Peptidase M16C associated domain-containing protein n=1 Tax=Reticulomyxa filosa TaxID=46433 RepID=X6MDV4_RETFI|nr:hypothetical protein RFI_25545 [Reticulomyxa filosa]|eukprot:ETO11831.1 hypothetical protein RFI_25545 [Reticulomyxa filosa]
MLILKNTLGRQKFSFFPLSFNQPHYVVASPCGANRKQLSSQYQLGEKTDGGFVIESITSLPIYEATAYQVFFFALRQKISGHFKKILGTRYIHLDTSDTNNVFAVALRTIPEDNSGVTHVLEHMTLCGSEKYPVKSPFVHMLKRSLNTLMNASTSADRTCFPFATQNEQDYHNLLNVYLDSIFFPELKEMDFMQEGHRLEFENGDVQNGRLQRKGLVYEKMKTTLSDPSEILALELQKNLFSDTVYRFNYAGDPQIIAKLTNGQLKRSIKNITIQAMPCSIPMAIYLRACKIGRPCSFPTLSSSCLSKEDANAQQQSPPIPLQPHYSHTKNVTVIGPPETIVVDEARQNQMAVAWLCNPIHEVDDTFGLTILSHLLLFGDNAPFRQALAKSGMTHSYTTATGYFMDAVQGSFCIGLTSVSPNDTKTLEHFIEDTLQKVVQQGFKQERLEEVLHQFEIDQKTRNGIFGLNLFYRMISLITHWDRLDANTLPVASLQIDKILDKIRAKVSGEHPTEPRYFENLISKYLLNNNIHNRVCVILQPDSKYLQTKQTQEEEELSALAKNLSEQNKAFILTQTKALHDYQTKKPNVDLLPTLQRTDIPLSSVDPCRMDMHVHTFELKNEKTNETQTLHCPLLSTQAMTNDLVYYRVLYDLAPLFEASNSSESINIAQNDFHLLLSIFAKCLTHVGAADKTPEQLAQAINRKTGGIKATIHSLTPANTSMFSAMAEQTKQNNLSYFLEMSSFCLKSNVDDMLQLMEEICVHPKFEFFERINTFLEQKMYVDFKVLLNYGENYATKHAASMFADTCPSFFVDDMLEGISALKFQGLLLRALQSQRHAVTKELIHSFEKIAHQLFRKQGPIRSLLVADKHLFSIPLSEMTDKFVNPFLPLGHFDKSSMLDDKNQHLFGVNHDTCHNLRVIMKSRKFVGGPPTPPLSSASAESKGTSPGREIRHYFAVPSSSDFCAAVIPTVPFTHEHCADLRVASKLLSSDFFRKQIREKGKAQNCGSMQNKNLFVMFTNQDSDCIDTIHTFKHGIDWLLSDRITDASIDGALLEIFGSLDAPKSPFETGFQELLQGINEPIRQEHRNRLLHVTKKSMQDAVHKYLKSAFEKDEVAYTIVGRGQGYKQPKEKEKLQSHGFRVNNLL